MLSVVEENAALPAVPCTTMPPPAGVDSTEAIGDKADASLVSPVLVKSVEAGSISNVPALPFCAWINPNNGAISDLVIVG